MLSHSLEVFVRWVLVFYEREGCMRTILLNAVMVVFLAGISFSQETSKALFHVASVESSNAPDRCPTERCTATKITVEGYTQAKDGSVSVEYVLDCAELIMDEPSPHQAVVCDHVHANSGYLVKIGSNYISFSDDDPRFEPLHAAYRIVSEKEPKHK